MLRVVFVVVVVVVVFKISMNVRKVHVKTVEVVQTPEEATVARVFPDSKERTARKVCAKTSFEVTSA